MAVVSAQILEEVVKPVPQVHTVFSIKVSVLGGQAVQVVSSLK